MHRTDPSDEAACQRQLQIPILNAAFSANNCQPVFHLPFWYPYRLAPAEQKRFVFHCWMDADFDDFDSCQMIRDVGDSSSVPRIERILMKAEHVPDFDARSCSLIDTSIACLGSLRQIQNLSDASMRTNVSSLSPAWAKWAASCDIP